MESGSLTIESKCRALKTQLKNLDYHRPFLENPIPLLEELVADILTTTDTLKHYTALSQNTLKTCRELEAHLDAYKRDNSKLTNELNQLHWNHLQYKEFHEKSIKELNEHIYRLEEENTRIVKARDISKSIPLSDGNVKPGNKGRVKFSHAKSVPKTESEKENVNHEGETNNILKIVEENEKLRTQYRSLLESAKTSDSNLQASHEEILRLNRMLEGGRPLQAVVKDASSHILDDHVSQAYVMQLQYKLKKAIDGQHEAKKNAIKQSEMCKELQDQLNRLRNEAGCSCEISTDSQSRTSWGKEKQQLEEELAKMRTRCESLEKSQLSSERLSLNSERNKLELDMLEVKYKRELFDLQTKCTALEESKLKIENELKELENTKESNVKIETELLELKRLNQEMQADKDGAVKKLNKKMEENRSLQNRNNHLTVIERDLTLEIGRLNKVISIQRRHVAELEEKVLQIYRNQVKESLTSDDSLTVKKKPLTQRRPAPKKMVTTKVDLVKSADNEIHNLKEKYQKEIKNIKCHSSEINVRNDQGESCDRSTETADLAAKEEQILKLRNLENNLEACKSDLSCLQGRVDDLNKKNLELSSSLKEKEELLHQSLADKTYLERLLTKGREQSYGMDRGHSCEHCTMAEHKLKEYEGRIRNLEMERRELLEQQSELRTTIGCDKQHLSQLRLEIQSLQSQLQEEISNSNKLRRLQGSCDSSMESSQRRLEGQLESMVHKLSMIQDERDSLKNQLELANKDLMQLQKHLNELDSKKDSILLTLDEKTERLASLQDVMQTKNAHISKLEQTNLDLQKKLELALSSSAKNDETSKRSSRELDKLRSEIEILKQSRDNALAENRRLQNDLTAVTKDCTVANKELENIKKNAQDLKLQVQDYIARVRSAEETLQQKESERSEMLEHFRTLTIEATQLESNNHTLESEARSSKNSLKGAQSRIKDLQQILDNKDSLITGYEQQLNELSQTVASLERQVSSLTNEKEQLRSDLAICRDLSSRIDNQKDSLSHTISALKSTKRTLEEECAKLQNEAECLQEQLLREKSNTSRLEKMLSDTRQESLEQSITTAELQDELRELRTNVQNLQESLDKTGKRLRESQSEAAEYQRQLTQLRRELTNVRYEHVRSITSDNPVSYSTL